MSEALNSISVGANAAFKNPVIFIPAIIPLVIHAAFAYLAYCVFGMEIYTPLGIIRMPNYGLLFLGSLIASIVGFIVGFVIIDMAHDALISRGPDMSRSFNKVMSRIGPLIVVAIVAAILAITIILLPVSIFTTVIAMVEALDVGDSISRAFSFIGKNLGEVIVYIIIVIVVAIILGLIPVIGSALYWIASVIFTAAAVDLYLRKR
ncbi:MAG: hypothetical protein DRJ56_03655 [Thermoprotei archaeon]|nr:MAG: hypothetical protein DRJ56_03655 [Thermoprotei archaeon]